MADVFILIVDIFFSGWLSWLGAHIRFFILRFFKDEREIREKIYNSESVSGSFAQEFYNALVGFVFVALFLFGIIWVYFY